MTATVGTLLDDVHARAWDLCLRVGDVRDEGPQPLVAAELLAAWPRLATTALRVLEAVRVEPVWLDEASAVREVLGAIAGGEILASLSATGGGASATARPEVLAIATRLGALADLLSGQPAARSEVDRAALLGLQVNVVAVVHAVAVATVAAMDDRDELRSAAWLMRGVVARSERLAITPAAERAGRYEDVAAIPFEDRSLDRAIARWIPAAVAALTSPHRVTQTALQFGAGDALILIATAGTVLDAATQLGLVSADLALRARSALIGANEAWRPCVSWPAAVRLHGVRDVEQFHASRQLRQLITDNLREGRAWLPADALAERLDVGALMGSMRRGMHGVGNVALAHFQAVDRLVRGPGQLWMSANAVTQSAYRGSATIEAACRKGWVPMPPGEPAGAAMLGDAKQALAKTTSAVAALDATAAAAASPAQRGPSTLRWDRGRIVAGGGADQTSLFETVRSPEPAGARSERRVPIDLNRNGQPGPRR